MGSFTCTAPRGSDPGGSRLPSTHAVRGFGVPCGNARNGLESPARSTAPGGCRIQERLVRHDGRRQIVTHASLAAALSCSCAEVLILQDTDQTRGHASIVA